MNIKDITHRLLIFVTLLAVAACSDDDNALPYSGEGVEMTGIMPSMTRAGAVADLKDYVGKSEFDNDDRAVFVSIKRTSSPITQFTYEGIEFVCAASTSPEGVTSIGWSRDKTKGTGGGATLPDRIYWSDATNEHTFTGYCTPQQGGGKAFDWKEESGAYYGSIGDPTLQGSTEIIDYRSTYDAEGKETRSGNAELCKNDILLTHSTKVKAEDAIAKLRFYHGLAQVRVIVNISDFAAGGGADTLSRVSDIVLKDMLTMYKWQKSSVATEPLGDGDQSILNMLYPSAGVTYDQRKDINLWIPQPNGVGWKSSRTFTFYGMVVPTQIPDIDESPRDALKISFKVSYPDPMDPTKTKTPTYNASIGNIRFDAGKCTTISISLNHKNEKMTVGAEYDDWEFENTPDQGELKKNSTFLSFTNRTTDKDGNYNVTIIGDKNATVDDATWLYVDTRDNNKIKDIYGNDGTEAHPFQISTADQLLSFAYEVKGTSRTSTTYRDLDGTDKTLADGFQFTGYHVSLDAGLTLQATEKKTKAEILLQNPTIDRESSEYTNAPSEVVTWIGIGAVGKPFNGNFNGGVRLISRLNGAPFFMELGPKAHVGQLILENVIDITGDGGLAEINRGVICACKVDGNVTSEASGKPVGSLVGVNYGLVFACYHTGNLTATNADVVGGLIGLNNGTGSIVACYNYGKITGKSGGTSYGVLGQFNSLTDQGEYNSVFGCYYDNTKAKNVSAAAPSTALSNTYPSGGMSTVDIMKSSFATKMNNTIQQWVEANRQSLKNLGQNPDHFKAHYYVSQPASYPYVY